MKLGNIKSVTIEYEDATKQTFYKREDYLTLENYRIEACMLNTYEGATVPAYLSHIITFSWITDEFGKRLK
jgi:hypothetical protein